MKSFKSIPYILLYVSIFFSILIAAIYNLSFIVFIKRTIPFFIILFSASFVLTYTIEKYVNTTVEKQPTIDIIIPEESITIEYAGSTGTYEEEEIDEENEFAPLNFDSIEK
ncbi:MAG: hypothetical protein AB2421_18220 [Thermotaleaceae bacterium]